MFNEIAKQLRQPTGFLGKILSKFLKRMNGEIYIQMIQEINPKNREKIFEIGYGHGSGVWQLVHKADCLVDGIDFSEVMYNDAVKLNRKFIDEGKVNLTFGDFLNTNITPNSYHKMFCVNVIYFWSNLETPFIKVKNSLKSNGVFFIYMDSLEEIQNSRFTNETLFHLYDINNVLNELNKLDFESTFVNVGRGHLITATKQ